MRDYPRLLVADKNKAIYDLPLQAAGMKGREYFPLEISDFIKLPPDSEFFLLPDRVAVGYDKRKGEFVELGSNPLSKMEEPCYPVAAFVAPGFTTLFNTAYKEKPGASLLPLFCYTAAAMYKGEFYASSVRVDRERRQLLKGMDINKVRENIESFRKIFGKNKMLGQIEICALKYGCPAAKNFFLKRYEGPLPVSSSCNSLCLGCISDQPDNRCSPTQTRINFSPKTEEIAEIALYHINNVSEAVVSFGQGCEGEPLTVGARLEEAIKIIRSKTKKGVININTNGSKPDVLKRLFSAGLNSMRLSVNSLREEYYNRYYRPNGYSFSDVMRSVKVAKKNGGFVSINYLTMPGFTDSRDESEALYLFLDQTGIDMIQWRNLNYDPIDYFDKLKVNVQKNQMLGIDVLINEVKRRFPRVSHGYFNPSRGRMRRNGALIA